MHATRVTALKLTILHIITITSLHHLHSSVWKKMPVKPQSTRFKLRTHDWCTTFYSVWQSFMHPSTSYLYVRCRSLPSHLPASSPFVPSWQQCAACRATSAVDYTRSNVHAHMHTRCVINEASCCSQHYYIQASFFLSFFTRWHVPPSHNSAEACLTSWPNARPQGWGKCT